MVIPASWSLFRKAIAQILIYLPLTYAHQPQEILSPVEAGFGPSAESAKANSAHIFNSIHSSMVCDLRPSPRQLGSILSFLHLPAVFSIHSFELNSVFSSILQF